jgi:squalene-hopene/tetraprenyl-beta-curcumene cyclase
MTLRIISFPCLAIGIAIGLAVSAPVEAQQPITPADVAEGLPTIRADEPPAASFSPTKGAEYLDRSALNRQKTKKCATCHSNLFYMAARPALRSIQPDSGEVRSFYEDYFGTKK